MRVPKKSPGKKSSARGSRDSRGSGRAGRKRGSAVRTKTPKTPWSERCKTMEETCKSSPTNFTGEGWCDVPEWAVVTDEIGFCFDVREIQSMIVSNGNDNDSPPLVHPFTKAPLSEDFLTEAVKRLHANGALESWDASVERYMAVRRPQTLAAYRERAPPPPAFHLHGNTLILTSASGFRDFIQAGGYVGAVKNVRSKEGFDWNTYNSRLVVTKPTGLQAFVTDTPFWESVKDLECDDNKLDELPALPSGLKLLSCSKNNLTKLPALPAGLESLACEYNKLSQLPTLPVGLQRLACEANMLTKLPTLPAGLETLDCSGNMLSKLPALPVGLEILGCYGNNLSELPALPVGLKELTCANNKLTKLPSLPSGLRDLYCGDNKLSRLPTLPPRLRTLYCYKNQLIELPTLPAGLELLSCSGNKLTELPALPHSLHSLHQ